MSNVCLLPVPRKLSERERLAAWYAGLTGGGRWGTPTTPTRLTPLPLRDLSRATRIPQVALPPLLVEAGWRPWRPLRGASTVLWQPPDWCAPAFDRALQGWWRAQEDPSPETLYDLIQSEAARETAEDAATTTTP